jgi:DNA-damage-inducible protein D
MRNAVSDEAKRWSDYPAQAQLGAQMRDNGGHLTLFQDFPIRRTWHEGEWWYSLVDCMGPLSGTPNPRRYWSDLKKRMATEEGVDVYALGVQLIKMPDPHGKMRTTDCANAEVLLRIVQSVRSPNAEPFKIWLARVGAMMMDDGDEHSDRVDYRAKLYQFDRDLHELVEFHGITTEAEHAALEDANYAGLYNVSCELDLLRRRPGHLPGTLPETMGSAELGANIFQRTMTADLISKRNLQGIDPIAATAEDVGVEIRLTIERIGGTMPEDMPQYPPLPPGEWMPQDHPARIQWDDDDEPSAALEEGQE